MKVLDLFSGAGGAGAGYAQAGFEVVGIDLNPQPNYPYPFVRMDAREAIRTLAWQFDLIHASPPCQHYSFSTRVANRRGYPDMISEVRDLLIKTGKPFVIENVPSARRELRDPLELCGLMFGLRTLKHRLFEVHGFTADAPAHVKHTGTVRMGSYVTCVGHGGDNLAGNGTLDAWRAAMGTPWMVSRREMSQAIPPAYTRHLGQAFAEQWTAAQAA